ALGCVFRDTIQVLVVPNLTPGSVSNVLPVNGSINQENILTFSWQPSINTISYDLYLWPSPGARPGSPTVQGIAEISTVLSNLNFGTLYNVQVVSRSACQSTNGPLQQLTTRSLPDLSISNIVSQASLGTPGVLSVTYTVTNQGTGVTLPGSWTDRLYLSIDSIIGSDILVGSKANVNALAGGSSYNGSFQIPVSQLGEFFLYVQTDAGSEVIETNEGNNLLFRNPGRINLVQANPSPDLVGLGQAFTPSTAVGDQVIPFTYTVRNQGDKDAKGTFQEFDCTPENCLNSTDFTWQDDVYISPSASFDGQAKFIGRATVNPRLLRNNALRVCNTCNGYQSKPVSLEIDSSLLVSSNGLRIPHDYSGQAFLHIVVNGSNGLGAFNENVKQNNGLVSNAFTVILRPPADLAVGSVTATPTSTQQGNLVKVKYRVTNVGTNSPKASEIPWVDRVYLSTTSVLNRATALVVYTSGFSGSSLNPNAFYNDSVTFQVPYFGVTPLFVFVETDVNNQVFEYTFEANNLSSGTQLNLDLSKKPDYVPSALVSASTAQSAADYPLTFTLSNSGNAAGAGTVKIHYNLKKVGSADAPKYLGESDVDALLIGSNTTVSKTVAIPTGLTPGNYELSILADASGIQPELNENNNTLLKVISVTASPSFALSLSTITHPGSIDIFQNQPSFDVSGLASFTLIQNGPGIPTEVLGKVLISQNALGSNALYEKSFTLSFPAGIPSTFSIPAQTINRNTVPSGNYFVVMTLGTAANGFDTDLADNKISQPVFFVSSPTPDVVMLNTPTSLSLASGSPFSIPLELKNLGINELSGKVVTKAFLSNSPSSTQVNGIATLGSSFKLPGITSMPTNVVFKDTIHGSVPLSFSGNYFLQLVTDADINTWEGASGEANNIITIPVAISAPVLPDLRPDALVLPANIEAGRTLSFNYVLRNIGAGSFSGTPKNTFRMSKLGVFNPFTDGETGQHQTGVNLNAGGNVSLSSSMVVSGLLPGPYKPGVFANSNFGAIESNYTNNEVYTASNRNIFINPVNLDVTASENNFNGDYFYRSVNIGAGLDILAEFEGQAAFASNGKVPTSSTSDFVSPEDGSKELIIPNAEAGQYFIGVKPNTSGITSLKVRALPFSIISISPNKVGQGNATTEIKGAAFTSQTLFILLNGSGTVVDTGTIRQLRNSMQARVTFHCQTLPLGFYTVRAIKPGLDTFDLANGLQVMPKSTTEMVSTDNFPAKIAASATVPLLYQFTNAGNTDVENAFAKVSFPAFANVKNVTISTNADGLKSLHAKSGVYDLDSAVTHELYDFMTYVPAWKRNVAPGESFSIAFNMAEFSATSDLFAQAYAINLPDSLFFQQIANQIEKVRALSIQKIDEIEDQNIVDSIGGYWSFQRLAFKNFQSAGLIKSADLQTIKAYDYTPSLYQPNLMKGFGLVSNPNEAEDLSLRLLCVTDLIEYNLPTEKELYFDYNDGVFVTYSSNFRRTAQDLINSACDGDSIEFKRRLNGPNRGGKLVGNLATGFVYGPIIYANIFGRFEPNAPKPGITGQPSTQSDGGSFFGGDMNFNNQRELFNQPPTPRRPPPPPPTKPAHKPFDPIHQFGDPGELPHKKPDAECDGISIPQCEVHVFQPKKQRCGVEYTVRILRICHTGGDGRSVFCFPNTPFMEEKVTTVSYSCDPNEIVGPEGVGSSKFVAKSDSLPFTILFENDPEFASAAAGTVRIVQPLDNNFEAGTLQLTQYGFGGKIFDVPTGQNSFSSQIDLSAEQGIKVNVLGTLDVINKQIFWQFTTIDAATGQPSVDPSKGFLPVNDSTGKGEGFVSYLIQTGIGTETGDSLRAQAEIFFDFNEPVVTNKHFNVVDALPPVTTVTSPSGNQASTEVVFEWTANDDAGGSGAAQTWILYKKDAGSLDTLGLFPADTAQIIGEGFETGHTYQFFFRSTDHVGNNEALPTNPQMTVVIGNAGPSFTMTAPTSGQSACSSDTL
ncbi:MAG TPA: CARDB domain-containing protein, partial [Catalimonadaceae bacterium]|nr:CARDB domain-containing protein [Catalimonadaceae bacterium]